MGYSKEVVAGTFFFVAAVQFVLGLVVAEALHPGYSVSANYVSDLGVGSYSIVFNSSVFVLGLILAIGAYFLRFNLEFRNVSVLLFLMALGAMAVGVFTKDFPITHGVVSSIAFFFSGLSAIASARVLKKPFSVVSIVLGAMTIGTVGLFSIGIITSGSIAATIAYDSIFYLGLGPGGMERMIIYSALMWLTGFSGYLIMQQKK
jgi:hypothetical membrane protein